MRDITRYHNELTNPFKEAMAFFKTIESQFNCLGKGTKRINSPLGNVRLLQTLCFINIFTFIFRL